MAPVLLIGVLPAANEKARDDTIAGLAKIADYAKANDPNTTKHATHLSTDPADPFTVVAIEEYASQEAADAHMKWPPVLEFLEQWKTDPGRLSGPPQIWHSTHAVQGFTRSALKDAENPHVLIATMQHSDEENKQKALAEWGPEVQVTSKNEPGTLSYAIGSDVENANKLTFVEAYESEAYLNDVHMKSPGLAKLLEAEKERKTELKVWFLKKVVGYLHK